MHPQGSEIYSWGSGRDSSGRGVVRQADTHGTVHPSTSRYLPLGGIVPACGRSFHRDRRRKSMDSNPQSPGVRPQTYSLDRAATGTGCTQLTVVKFKWDCLQLQISYTVGYLQCKQSHAVGPTVWLHKFRARGHIS